MFGLSKLLPKTGLFGKYNITYLSTEETYPVDAVSGSFMMVRKEAARSVGGLDEDFFMYGEDIDWCYRIRQAGWQVYYVHSTQIIHYKGESTRRSDLDEISTFYEAMSLFVKKHFRSSVLFAFLLRLSIGFVSFAAFLKSILNPLKVAILDFITVTVSLLIAEEIWRGVILQYPSYAYPIVFSVPAIIVIGSLYIAGVYTYRRMSISRSLVATFMAYILISALIAFFKEYAFSRMMVVISGIFSVIFIPGWRILFRLLGKTKVYGRGTLFGKRTLIVGINKDALELHKKLRVKIGEGYDVVGFIGTTHEYIGKIFNGIKIVGSIDNIGKVIREQKINDVIFAPKALGYTQILSVIGKCKEQTVGFHLVPTTMEVIISKANVHSLDDIPLVQITYNSNKLFHLFTKRVFDIVCSGLLLITVYPISLISSFIKGKRTGSFIRSLPRVFSGKMSLVGAPIKRRQTSRRMIEPLFLGKPGLCSLLQLQKGEILSNDEINQYNLYYARNQSILLDFEILIKSWLQYREKIK
jgi:lipopolysaccharide/colanic/teichoic acid biosynthesis glycosyltransferase